MSVEHSRPPVHCERTSTEACRFQVAQAGPRPERAAALATSGLPQEPRKLVFRASASHAVQSAKQRSRSSEPIFPTQNPVGCRTQRGDACRLEGAPDGHLRGCTRGERLCPGVPASPQDCPGGADPHRAMGASAPALLLGSTAEPARRWTWPGLCSQTRPCPAPLARCPPWSPCCH